MYKLAVFLPQTCDIQMEGGIRRLTLKNCQLDQAGEVSYQALNATTAAMLNVKGNGCQVPPSKGFLEAEGPFAENPALYLCKDLRSMSDVVSEQHVV